MSIAILSSQILAENSDMQEISMPTTVEDAIDLYSSGIEQIVSSQGISEQAALEQFRDYWYQILQDGDPSPTILNQYSVSALEQFGVYFDGVDVCEYVILPEGNTLQEYNQQPEKFKNPECIAF